MPQTVLPLFSAGTNSITELVGYVKKDETIYYFLGQLPLFQHHEKDVKSFRFITSQLVVNGHVRECDIIRAFGVPSISVKRGVKRLKEEGNQSFFKRQGNGKKPHVITEEIKNEIERRLNEGENTKRISKALNIKKNTIDKAIRKGTIKKKNFQGQANLNGMPRIVNHQLE